ncbi:hypothetical protein FF125_09310 [Aureibaculum algae]|uniref:Uncharacterized protein n=1 Tax=Aureibaculum algae TaxID=2584122 RepID=A0A5B7TNX0_9FLAO|nr:hypothetical protein [Aureibaculum algae]QCX38619.1 hypothetical protein FF125_09310 [Aureibaculum algae]
MFENKKQTCEAWVVFMFAQDTILESRPQGVILYTDFHKSRQNKKPIKTQRVFGLLCFYWIPNQGSRPQGVILFTDFRKCMENKKTIKTQRVFGLLCFYWIPNQGSRPQGVILFTDFRKCMENKKQTCEACDGCYVCIELPS